MLFLSDHFKALSYESQIRLKAFYERFCQDEYRRQYGLGHLIYACHASFPLLLSADLANLIWVNFKNYHYQDGTVAKADAIAVADFLVSPLCRPIGYGQFEVYPDIRSFLLYLLQDGRWLEQNGIALNGVERLNELSDFLRQYLNAKATDKHYSGSGFRQVNKWAALAFANPGKLAAEIADSLLENAHNDQGQIWLNTQLERLEKQLDLKVYNNHYGKEELIPFYNLIYYSKARKAQLFDKSEQVMFGNSIRMESNTVEVTPTTFTKTYKLPLLKRVAERTERKIHKVQRVISLLIGIDEYKQGPLHGCVHSVQRLRQLLEQFDQGNEGFLQTPIEGGYDTKTVFTVLNEEATRQNIFESLATIFNEANPEDICLVYFSGHGQNRSFYENTLMPVDFGLGNSPNLVDRDFFKVVEEGKRKTGCQVVLILDSHTGYYRWVGDNDIFLGAVRHTMQTEVTFDGKDVESPFFNALTYIISHTKGMITYRHLLIWLRFLIKNAFPNVDQVPVMVATPSNFDNYFLKKDLRNTDDAPVIAFNHASENWQVLQEDFKLITIDTRANLKVYDANVTVEGATGEVFVSESGFLFEGTANDLNRNTLYRLDVERPPLAILVNENVSHRTGIKQELNDLRFDAFSKWHGTKVISSEIASTSGHRGERIVLDRVEGGYSVRFESENLHEQAMVEELYINDEGLLKESLAKFVRYHYLYNLDLPKPNYKLYGRLSVHLHHRWLDRANEKEFNWNKLIVNEEAFRVNDGRIHLLPLELQLSNDEEFPVFCTACLLSSDLNILQITTKEIYPLLPNTALKMEVMQTEFFGNILAKGLSGQIRLLVSRDPLQHNFSQTGFEKPLTV